MVGIPRGRSPEPFGFGIHTRFTGFASYLAQSIFLSAVIASYFCSSVVHRMPSMPGVFPPLLVVTLLTAIARAAKLVNILLFSLCNVSKSALLSRALNSSACIALSFA